MNSLKDATAENHRLAENTDLVRLIFSKQISTEQYSNLLINQLIYYSALEQHKLVDSDMSRVTSIIADIRELARTIFVVSPLSYDYADYISTLTPQQCWAHIYVHYLGDMMGGQMLKRCVPGTARRFDFKEQAQSISTIRMNVSIADAAEANRAFEWTIRIYDDLYRRITISS